MNIRHLQTFVSVCEHGSVTAAAKALFVSQPAVSAAIIELENEYHVKLFERISKKLFITQAGENLLAQARYLINTYRNIEDYLSCAGEQTLLRVGSSITIGCYYLPKIVRDFTTLHHNTLVKAKINNSENLAKMILDNDLDLAIIEGVPNHKELVSEVFAQDELFVVCAPDHPFVKQADGITTEQLLASKLILRERGSGTRELFESTMALHGSRVDPFWESISTQAIIGAVKAGIGISVLPERLVQDDVLTKSIALLKLTDAQFLRNYYIIYHHEKQLSKAMAEFIQTCHSVEMSHQTAETISRRV